jgi:hypothetical protein
MSRVFLRVSDSTERVCLPRIRGRCAGRSRGIRYESQDGPRFVLVVNAHDEARVGTRDSGACCHRGADGDERPRHLERDIDGILADFSR